MAECSVCGSQDTTYKTGIAKATGKPWAAYDCNEPQCKNDKGYPSRTFVKSSKPKGNAYVPNQSNPISSLEQKVDKILAILKANFPDKSTHKEDEAPF